MGFLKKRKESDTVVIQITSMIDMLTILIAYLLVSVSVASVNLALLDANLPAFSNQQEQQQEEKKDEKPKLGLTVVITEQGFVLGGQGGLLGSEGETPSIPKLANGKYDYEVLGVKLYEIKQKFPDEWSVILVPSQDTVYDVVIQTMDALREYIVIDVQTKVKTRKVLFPNIALGGGIL
jgi:biopolymer transport protein TolR